MIYCIVPFSRSSFQQNVCNNFYCQNYNDKQLIIVQNCGAKWNKQSNEIILESENGVSQPMNIGLEWIRQNGNKNDWFTKFDDDDSYFPNYLNTIKEGIEKGADVIGRSSGWIKNTENKLWFIKTEQECFSNNNCHGPTLAGRIDISEDFPIVKQYGEDQQWWDNHRQYKQWHGPANSFVYNRYINHNHAYPLSDRTMKHIYSGRLYDVIKGSPENNYPTEMKLIQEQLYGDDFDNLLKDFGIKND
jgi:hypothetical protein